MITKKKGRFFYFYAKSDSYLVSFFTKFKREKNYLQKKKYQKLRKVTIASQVLLKET